MVTFKDVFRQLIRDVRSEKLRTFLTLFGIVWGTVAISLMLAFGTGLHYVSVPGHRGQMLGKPLIVARNSFPASLFDGQE